MLIEMRTYTFLPGKMPEFLALVEKVCLPMQLRHLGQCVGFFSTDVGKLNQLVQMWAYKDMNDREIRRVNLYADPDWQSYLDRAFPMILSQENCLLRSTSFSPVLTDVVTN